MASRYLHCCLAGFGLLGALYLVDAGLEHASLHGLGRLLDDTLLGMVAGLGLYFFLRRLEASRELRRRRRHEELISNLNHHIRNGLQVIINRAELDLHGPPELRDIENAVKRIDWALRVYVPDGSALAGSALAATPTALQPVATASEQGRSCPGIYSLYLPGIKQITADDFGPKLTNETQQPKHQCCGIKALDKSTLRFHDLIVLTLRDDGGQRRPITKMPENSTPDKRR